VTSKLFKLVYFVPQEELAATREALFAAGAGRLGDYERRSWFCRGTGTFLAGAGAAALTIWHARGRSSGCRSAWSSS
jgi:hypothetical protein